MASPFTSFTNGGSSSNGFFLSPPRPTTTTEDDTHQQQKNTIENPFLARGSPIVTTNSNINKRQHESPASGIRIGQHTPLSHSSIQASELRNRKYNNSPPPPKTSLFLGSTGGNSLAQSLPVENDFVGYKYKDQSQTSTALATLPNGMTETPTSTSGGSWIVVYGCSTAEQQRMVLERFRSYGTILQHRGGNPIATPAGALDNQNWIALQYESRLQVQKALCQGPYFLLAPGVICGVTRLEDDDPILMYQNSSNSTTNKYITNGGGSGQITRVMRPSVGDLLLMDRISEENADTFAEQCHRDQGICERFFRWLLSIH